MKQILIIVAILVAIVLVDYGLRMHYEKSDQEAPSIEQLEQASDEGQLEKVVLDIHGKESDLAQKLVPKPLVEEKPAPNFPRNDPRRIVNPDECMRFAGQLIDAMDPKASHDPNTETWNLSPQMVLRMNEYTFCRVIETHDWYACNAFVRWFPDFSFPLNCDNIHGYIYTIWAVFNQKMNREAFRTYISTFPTDHQNWMLAFFDGLRNKTPGICKRLADTPLADRMCRLTTGEYSKKNLDKEENEVITTFIQFLEAIKEGDITNQKNATDSKLLNAFLQILAGEKNVCNPFFRDVMKEDCDLYQGRPKSDFSIVWRAR